MEIISTSAAPQAIGPYSQAIRTGNLIFCSGQIALIPDSGQLIGNDTVAQTEQVLHNLQAVLQASGCTLENVVKTTIFLKNINDFSIVNEIYTKYFGESKPARATVEVSNLPKGALVEIECIAVKE